MGGEQVLVLVRFLVESVAFTVTLVSLGSAALNTPGFSFGSSLGFTVASRCKVEGGGH